MNINLMCGYIHQVNALGFIQLLSSEELKVADTNNELRGQCHPEPRATDDIENTHRQIGEHASRAYKNMC